MFENDVAEQKMGIEQTKMTINRIKYINQNHTDDFDALLKKIPKSINFGFMGIALDNVNWYDTISQKPEQDSYINVYIKLYI